MWTRPEPRLGDAAGTHEDALASRRRIALRVAVLCDFASAGASYAAEMPPLTLIACPVNRAVAGLHKNTASAAMSSAVGTPS